MERTPKPLRRDRHDDGIHNRDGDDLYFNARSHQD